MTTLQGKQMENAGTEAVKRLRLENLQNGHPFMINSKDLPKRQSYLEYPDGVIKLVTLSTSGTEFITIRVLSKIESAALRRKFDLAEYHA
jgi:hypothetical protein